MAMLHFAAPVAPIEQAVDKVFIVLVSGVCSKCVQFAAEWLLAVLLAKITSKTL